jgi:hypothetical protein
VIEVMLKRFETPDEVRTFEKGRLEVVRLGGLVLGRASYEPGWRWSRHVGPLTGESRCSVEHVGTVVELREGSLFHIPAVPHDSWVVGEKPYVSLHLMGADTYARTEGAGSSAGRAK